MNISFFKENGKEKQTANKKKKDGWASQSVPRAG